MRGVVVKEVEGNEGVTVISIMNNVDLKVKIPEMVVICGTNVEAGNW